MNEERLIYTTYDSFEAEQVIAMLKSNDIPAYKQEHGAGQYLSLFMGMNTTQCIDIIIPSQAEEKAVAVVAILFFIVCRPSEEEKICAFVKGHESELQEISMQQLSGNHSTITYQEVTVDGVFENSNDKPIVQFSYTGKGLVPSSKYYGFYYSPSDSPSAYQNVDIGLEEGNGAWEWHQANGDNGGVTKKIKDRWYYYESWF